MKITKAQKFAVAVLALAVLFLVYINQTQVVSFDWNAMFNGTLQTVVGGFITMALTIVVYRYLYHRRSRS